MESDSLHTDLVLKDPCSSIIELYVSRDVMPDPPVSDVRMEVLAESPCSLVPPLDDEIPALDLQSPVTLAKDERSTLSP